MLLEVYNRKTLPKVETERLLLRQRKGTRHCSEAASALIEIGFTLLGFA